MQSSDVRAREAELLASVDYESIPAVTAVSQELRSLVQSSELPRSAVDAIRGAYGELCGEAETLPLRCARAPSRKTWPEPASRVSCRPICGSRVPTPSWSTCGGAGGGFFTPEALTYRHRQQVGSENALMSVGVQRMVRARSAGVMFTLNPINGDRSKVVIESTWGLGEPLVAGEVDPDRFVVDKVMLEVLEKSVSDKQIEYRPDLARRRVVVADVNEERRRAASISDAEAVELARLGKTVERHYGSPQDVEWAIDADGGSLLVLQARPETVWSRREREPTVQKKGSALEYVLADLLRR